MQKLLAFVVLLLVGCVSASPRIVIGSPSERSGVVADVSSPVLAAVLPAGAVGMSIERVGEGEVQVVAEDATTVQVCWGGPALAVSDRAYLRVELLEAEARFEEHRVDFSAEPEERGGWNPGTTTVVPERALVGLQRLGHDPISPQHHVHLRLHPDGRYEATMRTTPSSSSSASLPGTVEDAHLVGGPIWIPWSNKRE